MVSLPRSAAHQVTFSTSVSEQDVGSRFVARLATLPSRLELCDVIAPANKFTAKTLNIHVDSVGRNNNDTLFFN